VNVPSTQWREVVLPDEDVRHEQQARIFVEMQRRRAEKYGDGRALHRQQVAGLAATLTVHEELPDYARHGIFAAPVTYEARVRLSNGSFNLTADRTPDIRGFAVKVLGLSQRLPAGLEQNFAMVNQETVRVRGSADVVGIVDVAGSSPAGALRKALKKPELLPAAAKNLRDMTRPFSGFATSDFFTVMPVAFGDYAARLKLCAATTATRPKARRDWAADIYARLAEGDLEFAFQAQFFEDEHRTPIEDPAVRWDAPWLTVAQLRIPSQTPDQALARAIEQSTFNPWAGAPAHRPLGEMMRARKAAYFASGHTRDAAS
jgi:hypothetical protein